MGIPVRVCYYTYLLLFFMTSLLASEQEVDYTRYVNGIIERFTKEVKKKYGIVCVGSGGSMPQKVEEITLFFHCYQRTSLEEARILYIKLVDHLLDIVNRHERIRPFLKQYPFPHEGAGIFLSFHKKSGSYHLDGSIAYVCQGRGQLLCFGTAEKQTILSPATLDIDGSIMFPESEYEDIVLVDLLDEPYADAERIVHAERSTSAR